VCLWRRWGDSDAAPEAWFPGGRYMGGGGDGRHDIAVPLLAWGDGGARGSPPRRKLSTMIMRPPQQGHGGRWFMAAPAAMSASSCSVEGSIDGKGAVISSLARAILALQVALASNP
jgi:hypothetical protein